MPPKTTHKKDFRLGHRPQRDPQEDTEKSWKEKEGDREITRGLSRGKNSFPENHDNRENKKNHDNGEYRQIRENIPENDSRKIYTPSTNLLLKYNCRFCSTFSPRVLHPSNFLQQCKQCNGPSHLKNLQSSYKLLMGSYDCQQKRCSSRWVQRLPFKNVILNTPVCERCHKMTKISQIFFNGVRVSFKNSLLYKCGNCAKCKSISVYNATQKFREGQTEGPETHRYPSNPQCESCQIPMGYIRNLKNIFFSLSNDALQRKAKSLSPNDHHYKSQKEVDHLPRYKEVGDRDMDRDRDRVVPRPLAKDQNYSKFSHPYGQRGGRVSARGGNRGDWVERDGTRDSARGGFRGGNRGGNRGGRGFTERGGYQGRGGYPSQERHGGRGGMFHSKNFIPRHGKFAWSHGDSPQEIEKSEELHRQPEEHQHIPHITQNLADTGPEIFHPRMDHLEFLQGTNIKTLPPILEGSNF